MSVLLAALAILGVILTTAQAVLVRRFRRRAADGTSSAFVSILKPVCGLDDELEENLLSFVALDGIRYEVIVSAEDRDDPALEVVQRVMCAHPEAPFRVVVDGGSRRGVVNRKVERLIAAARVATGDILLVSDSNVRVDRDAIAKTVALFDDPRVGCVSNLFTGAGAKTLGATIESLHLLGFVAPGAVLAATAGIPCVVGKSMALSRRAYEAIGGFASFVRVLAEDQAVGLAVKRAGFEVRLSPVVVRNV
ncbi:MAG TPA: glycosyltransferase, partial [Thermoanaerobaculia bacterium]|nr:glycosyltransferase [Thermoanaerobaculia bacterium]